MTERGFWRPRWASGVLHVTSVASLHSLLASFDHMVTMCLCVSAVSMVHH